LNLPTNTGMASINSDSSSNKCNLSSVAMLAFEKRVTAHARKIDYRCTKFNMRDRGCIFNTGHIPQIYLFALVMLKILKYGPPAFWIPPHSEYPRWLITPLPTHFKFFHTPLPTNYEWPWPPLPTYYELSSAPPPLHIFKCNSPNIFR
jgi:hypothetical protein